MGTATLYGQINHVTARHKIEYDADNQAYSGKPYLQLDGKIYRQLQPLTIAGRKGDLVGMELEVAVSSDSPIPFENPDTEQTQMIEGGLPAKHVFGHLGWFSYHGQPDGDHGEGTHLAVNVFESVYQELWHWTRLGCPGRAVVAFSVFGKRMRRTSKHNIEYEWFEDLPLHVVGFDVSLYHDVKTYVSG